MRLCSAPALTAAMAATAWVGVGLTALAVVGPRPAAAQEQQSVEQLDQAGGDRQDAGEAPLVRLLRDIAQKTALAKLHPPQVQITLRSGSTLDGEITAFLADQDQPMIVLKEGGANDGALTHWVVLSQIESVSSADPSLGEAASHLDVLEEGDGANRTNFRKRVRDAERKLASALDADLPINVDFDTLPDDAAVLSIMGDDIDRLVQLIVDRSSQGGAPWSSAITSIDVRTGKTQLVRQEDKLELVVPADAAIPAPVLENLVRQALDG